MSTTKEISIGDIGSRGAEASTKLDGDKMALNVGPSHPTTHGVLRLIMELDGDLIEKCEPVLGYLHRGDEKIAENMTYNQFVPYTDRLDYLAPLANNVAYALTVEKLTNIEIPPRCQAIRVLVCEMARISSHLLGMGVFGMDAGAWTPFMYTFTEREKLYTLFEELTGARFTTSYTRIGGVARDVPDGWLGRVESFVDQLPKAIGEVEKLLTRNRIFLDRTEGIGEISKEDALAYGLTGPFPDENYTMANYTAFLKDFLIALNIKQCVLAGNSLGGAIAWNFTLEQPSMVTKLILINASGYPIASKSVPIAFSLATIPVINKLLTFITPRFLVRSSVENVYFDNSKVTDLVVERYFNLTLRAGNRKAFVDRLKLVKYQEFVPHRPVQGFNETVVGGPARTTEVHPNFVTMCVVKANVP